MLKDFENHLKLNQKSQKTIDTYLSQLKPYFIFCKNTPSQESFDDYFLKKIEQKASQNSLNLFLSSIKTYCNFAKIELELPKQKGRKKKERPYWTEKQFREQILCMINMLFRDYYDREELLKVMFYTGLRPEELTKLKRSDIDFEKQIITVKDGKGEKDRIIPFLSTEVENILKGRKEEYVFNFTYTQINYTFKVIKKELYLDYEVTPYIMRRSFAKFCLEKGLDVTYIKKLLGHEDLETTLIYAEPDEKMIYNACKKIKEG